MTIRLREVIALGVLLGVCPAAKVEELPQALTLAKQDWTFAINYSDVKKRGEAAKVAT
jgi:hypothetical protein